MAAVLPLPSVPAIWTDGEARCGEPNLSRMRRILSRWNPEWPGRFTERSKSGRPIRRRSASP